MFRSRTAVLAGLLLVGAAGLSDGRPPQRGGGGYRPPPPPTVEPVRPVRPVEPVRPGTPHVDPGRPPSVRPGPPHDPPDFYRPGEFQRQAAQQAYRERLATYDRELTAYTRSEKALADAAGRLKAGDPAAAVKLLQEGYTGAPVPLRPKPPDLSDPVAYSSRLSDLYDLRGSGLDRPDGRGRFLAEYRAAVVGKLDGGAEPWAEFADHVAAAGGKVAADHPFVRDVLAEAAALCADRSLAVVLRKAEAGDWADAVWRARRAGEQIDLHFGKAGRPDALKAPADAVGAVVAAGELPAKLDVVKAALVAAAAGDAAGLRGAKTDGLSAELLGPVRGAVAAADLAAARAAAKPPAVAGLTAGVRVLRESDPGLADRVAVDAAGRAFLDGRPADARTVLNESKGDAGPAAAALLRDLKAVALGEGTVATDAGRRAVPGPGDGGPTPRGPPAVEVLVPEGDRAGYRPPVREAATAGLPPLDVELKAATAAAAGKATAAAEREPARIARRKLQALADASHARTLEQVRLAYPVFEPAPVGPALGFPGQDPFRDLDPDLMEFVRQVEKILGRELGFEEERLVRGLRRANPELTPEAAAARLAPGEVGLAKVVRQKVGRPLTPAEVRVAEYLEARGVGADEVAAWVGGDPLPAPRPKAESDP